MEPKPVSVVRKKCPSLCGTSKPTGPKRQVRGGPGTLNQELDNIKAQITRHYQYICDHDSFVTAKKVYNRYVGFQRNATPL